MVARAGGLRPRKLRHPPPLESANETDPSPSYGSLVQVDAHGVDVALAWPVPVPDVRAAAQGVLGASLAGRVARAPIAARDPGPQHFCDNG
jgi:hypothetical protein